MEQHFDIQAYMTHGVKRVVGDRSAAEQRKERCKPLKKGRVIFLNTIDICSAAAY